MGNVLDAHKQLFWCMKREDEEIEDYFDCFKNHAEIMENNGGESETEGELIKQDEIFGELSEVEQEDENTL